MVIISPWLAAGEEIACGVVDCQSRMRLAWEKPTPCGGSDYRRTMKRPTLMPPRAAIARIMANTLNHFT